MQKKELQTKKWVMPVLLGAAFVLITVSGILVRQNILFLMPLYISLVVATFNSRVSRYGSLLGGINSVFYAAVYLYYGLYANALYALTMSCPLQLITFFRWKKRPWGHSTVFRKMSAKQRVLTLTGFAAAWVLVHLALKALGSSYLFIDTFSTLIGLLTTLLTMLAYAEYTWIMLPNALVTTITYCAMTRDNPEQLPYVIYSLYGLLCTCIAFVRVRRLYAEQQAAKTALLPQEDASEKRDMQKM